MQLEKEFFAGQPLNSQVRQLRLLVIDFDETITTRDTSGTIAKTAIQAVVSKVSEASKSEDLVQELADKHSWLIRNYTDRRTSLLEDALPPEGEVRTEFDMGWLGDFVDRLADFDREMNTVVVDSGILKGVRREQLAQAGAAVEMQPGSLAVMQKAVKAGIPVAVVSVSWSAEFVRAALAQQGLPVVVSDSDGQGADVPSVSAVTVYANELEYFGDERCECGADKARLLDDLLLGLAAEAGSGGDAVYVGDSMTDVPPLISADVGLVVEVVMADVGAAAVKTGMLPDAASPGVEAMLREHLFPLATLITPNLPEAAALLGDGRAIVDLEGMRAAARELHALGPSWVLPSRQQTVTDVLFDGRTMLELSEPLVVSDNVHGTGCCLATAIACELARGHSVLAAVRRAKRYLWRTLERSRGLPLGDGPQRTMNFGWATADWAADLAAAGVPMPPRVPNAADLRLYAITDPALNERAARSLIDAVRLAIDGGATLVQVRDKNSPARAFAAAAAEALEHARARGVPLVINDRLDVALAIGADGVHLGQDDLPAAAARRLLGPDRILGVSVKTPEQAARAAADGADYVGCGGFAPTNTKAGNLTVGPEGVAAVVRARVLPVVAIGGIGEGNASAALATGADGVAVISAIFGAPDVVRATKRLRAVVDAALTARGLSEGGEEA
ncbi:Thiamine-phosphate synthase [Auxenochlorella protothecoides]|uniref:thiamine phosphate synthase n=1 Tax=Auxenochlorella protothecoides TaxID=3075 RepID=A0A087SDM7_AUXPR|nr:Thiamine-phosphate synthase [Auxenochlorella protothecoides]KFM23831.1 Thiamine-phosphate synthase [Auxenochlorella protothecoides]